MKVAELMELLSQADPDAEVHYSYMAFSEYGEDIEGDGSFDEDAIVIDDDVVTFHRM